MPTSRVILIGAGGHAKVVYDALQRSGEPIEVEVRDDDERLDGSQLLDCRITTPAGGLEGLTGAVHVAIGDNRARSRVCRQLRQSGTRLWSVIHPEAVVSPHARLGAGVFLAAGAIVAPAAVVGEAVIVNHGAVVDHDCQVGAWAHVAPRATLGGGVRVGEGALVGAAAVVLPGVSIGDWVVIGAGAVVTRDVEDGQTVVGVPARPRPR
jgi:sugar O-acyltransferase (sialic acid O-acetyltransferase NeuD family)